MVKCIEKDCSKDAIFGLKTDNHASYCKTHKQSDMTDIVNKKCLECDKIPLYNFKGIKPGIYCNRHKKDDMVNVRHRYCISENCDVQATFGEKGKLAEYCAEHRKENMVHLYFNKCHHEDCNERAFYNVLGEKGRKYCRKHKMDTMTVIGGNCKFKDCPTTAVFNYEGKIGGMYCTQHKLDGMINVKNIHCKTPLCYTRITKKYEGYCFRCFIYTFPDKPVVLNYKTKEKAVSDFILEEFPGFTWVTDKKVADGCSKRRPDLYLDLGYQVIIVEVEVDLLCKSPPC